MRVPLAGLANATGAARARRELVGPGHAWDHFAHLAKLRITVLSDLARLCVIWIAVCSTVMLARVVYAPGSARFVSGCRMSMKPHIFHVWGR